MAKSSSKGTISAPVAVVQLRLRIRLTEKKSAQVYCSFLENWCLGVFVSRFDDSLPRYLFN